MFKQKHSYRKSLMPKTHKLPKSKEKIELKLVIKEKQVKAKSLQKMLVYNDFRKKRRVIFKKSFFAFLKVFKLLSVCSKF